MMIASSIGIRRLARRSAEIPVPSGILFVAGMLAGCLFEENGPFPLRATPQLMIAVERAVGSQPLDPQESDRLADAASGAFTAPTGKAITYTIELLDIDAEPTVVSAKPVGPLRNRPDSAPCRPIELSVIKNGMMTAGRLTVCRDARSDELKPLDN